MTTLSKNGKGFFFYDTIEMWNDNSISNDKLILVFNKV